jgi:hypothetical protein
MALATDEAPPLEPKSSLTIYSSDINPKSLRILHAAETLKAGIATVLSALQEHQLSSLRTRSVAAIMPSSQRDQLAGFADEYRMAFERSCRDARWLIALAETIGKSIGFRSKISHPRKSFARGFGRLHTLTLKFYRERKIVYSRHVFALIGQALFGRKLFDFRQLASLVDRIICISKSERTSSMQVGSYNA